MSYLYSKNYNAGFYNEDDDNIPDEFEYENDDDYYFSDYDNYYYSHINLFPYDFSKSIENKYKFDNKINFTTIIDKQIEPYPYIYIPQYYYLNILIIAEKPSIARTLSKILCTKKNKNTYKDLSKKYGWCYYTFSGEFKGIKAYFTISSVAGHLYQTEFLRMHQNNQKMDPGELFDVITVKTEASDDTQMTEKWLNDLAKKKDILLLWLDCDAEGENICYEVIHNTLPYMNKRNYQQIYRAIFSSLSKEDIKQSFNNIGNYPDDKLSLSVDAREVIDLKVGVSLTRFLTNEILPSLSDKGDKIKTNVLSYGPCQTPTLWFCVERQRKYMNNINKCYYKIFLEINNGGNNTKIYLDENYDDENKITNIINAIKNLKEKKILINEINIEKRTKSHPCGLNTAKMLKIASDQLRISPQQTMRLAEKLYMNGLISYPRTETTQYSKNYNIKENLNKFMNYNNDVKELINNINENVLMLNEGIDMGDHPPITPTRKINNKLHLSKNELNLYDLICNYYFASLSSDMIYDNVKYKLNINNEIFNSTCSIIKQVGFSKFLPYEQKLFFGENALLKKDTTYDVINIGYEEKKIEDYITEGELIEEMEKNHIGTDASMSTHIENIVRRGYVTVDEERKLKPTQLGIALIEALENVEPEIVLPKNRARIEAFVKELSDGKNNYENVLNIALDFYKKKYYNISNQVEKVKSIFEKYLK